MHFDGRYPDVSLADWSTFEECFDRLSYTAVLNRYDAGLMPWFFPLARGVIVAASQMERKLFPALRFPRHFVEEREGFWTYGPLIVREWSDAAPMPLWSVERWIEEPRVWGFDEVLVHTFGATPIFTTDRKLAMAMAVHSHYSGPLPGTQWMRFPDSEEELNRQMDHASVRDDLAYLRHLSVQISKPVQEASSCAAR